MARIEIEDLHVALDGRPVLEGIGTVLVERRIGIVGRNGSGKSTLARAIAGLVSPRSGQVRIDGVAVSQDRRGALRKVGILFQNPDHQIIFPTVGEEIAFGLRQMGRSQGEAREAVAAVLSRFGRDDWIDRSVAELSQGQRHLVCAMAVLVMTPEVVILDEPFAALDIPTTRGLRALLEDSDCVLVQIAHDVAALSDYDRVLWIENGRLEADGPPDAVLDAFVQAMQREGQDAFADRA